MSQLTQDVKTVVITLPNNNTTNLAVTQNTTVGQIVDILVKMIPEGKEPGEEYGITLQESPEIVFERHTKIAKIPTDKFILRKTIISLQVQYEDGRKEMFGLDPQLNIKQTILFLEATNFKSCNYSLQHKPPDVTPNHELYFLSNARDSENVQINHGLLLDFDRTLQSYRLKQKDLLIMKKVQSKSLPWKNITGDNDICIIITCPEHNQQKTMLFPPTTTYEEVCEKFLNKANIKESKYFYSLYVNVGTIYELMHPHWNLLSFPLPTPARLECKYKTREAKNHFGVDPLSLTFVNDNGFFVPEVLAIMKDMLLLNGVEEEGVFRKAGLESELNSMRDLCDSGKPFNSRNIHSIATLMKRWFKDLPKRLFAHMDNSYVVDDRCLNISELLTPLEQSLAYWLFDLLLTVADQENVNKMSISNLAIVWGPGMVGSLNSLGQIGNVMDSVNETRLGVELVEKNLTYLRDKRPLPRIDIKHLITINEPIAVESHQERKKESKMEIPEAPKTAICLCNNVAEKEGQISVQQGDVVKVLDNTDPDWVMISNGESKGLIPRSHLEFQLPRSMRITENSKYNTISSPPTEPKFISVGNVNKNNNNNNIINNNTHHKRAPSPTIRMLQDMITTNLNKKENQNVNSLRRSTHSAYSISSIPVQSSSIDGKSKPTKSKSSNSVIKSQSNFNISLSPPNVPENIPKLERNNRAPRPKSVASMLPVLPQKSNSHPTLSSNSPSKLPPKPSQMRNQKFTL